MHPASVPTRVPPVPAIAAAVLGLLSAGMPAVFALIAFGFSGGEFPGATWLLVVVPLILVAGLVAGGVLLLAGRSWLALAFFAGALTVFVLAGYVMGGFGGGTFGVLTVVVPLTATVLAALPRVRRWVAARRQPRPAH